MASRLSRLPPGSVCRLSFHLLGGDSERVRVEHEREPFPQGSRLGWTNYRWASQACSPQTAQGFGATKRKNVCASIASSGSSWTTSPSRTARSSAACVFPAILAAVPVPRIASIRLRLERAIFVSPIRGVSSLPATHRWTRKAHTPPRLRVSGGPIRSLTRLSIISGVPVARLGVEAHTAHRIGASPI